MSVRQFFRATFAAVALVVVASSSQASELYAPSFCDLAVTLPFVGKRVEQSLDLGPAFREAGSIMYAAKNYMVRAQCARYVSCNGKATQATYSTEDLRAVSGPLNLDPSTTPVYGFEQHPLHGRVGLIQGKSKLSGMEFDLRAAVYFGSCSRLTLVFGSLTGSGDGWAEWTRTKNSVRAR